MGFLRAVARMLLAWVFVYGGLEVLRHPEPRARVGKPVVDSVRAVMPLLPEDDTVLVRANAAVMVSAGILLALGKFRKLAPLALAISLVPTTLAGHRFWTIDDPTQRAQHVIHVNKNLALIGGLIVAAIEASRDR